MVNSKWEDAAAVQLANERRQSHGMVEYNRSNEWSNNNRLQQVAITTDNNNNNVINTIKWTVPIQASSEWNLFFLNMRFSFEPAAEVRDSPKFL
jgi:hypothetical protein